MADSSAAAEQQEARDDLETRQRIASTSASLVSGCAYVGAPAGVVAADGSVPPTEPQKLQHALRRAHARLASGTYYLALERTGRNILSRAGIAPPTDSRLDSIRSRTAAAGFVIDSFGKIAFSGSDCTPEARKTFDRTAPRIYYTPWATAALWGEQARVAIYEIGPREQAQQMSTVARSANSLGLALSIAASAPGSGVAADAAASYSRQAMGRAEALERLPSVVGYSVASLKTFGWVLGPKAIVDPKGKINLEQGLRAYDLTVDLSVPGWWSGFELETVTAWAPNRAQLVSGSIALAQTSTPGNYVTRRTYVPMSPNDADYSGFTSRLAWGGFEPRREPEIPSNSIFSSQKVSACRASTLVLVGESLWRASAIVVGGVKLGSGSISVLPDMGGILVDVPALDDKIVAGGTTVQLSLLTPYGPSISSVGYEPAPEGGCKKEAKADPDAPSVTRWDPKRFQVPGRVPFTIEGEKLDKVKKVTLNGARANVIAQSATSLEVEYTRDMTDSWVPTTSAVLTFYYLNAKGEQKTVEKPVEIVANVEGN